MLSTIEFYRQIYRIRRFEETILENFASGIFFGTTHTSIGQEANAVGVISCLLPSDIVFSNHRGHGHFIARGGELVGLFAEMMGRNTGVCGGRGGSQHLYWKNFYTNGVQGGIVPLATGAALAEKNKNSNALVVVFLGDGTLGEGVVYEALNMASLWQAPILYVVENNHIAQTTPIEMGLAGTIHDRFHAFRIPCTCLESSDVERIAITAHNLLEDVRDGKTPRALILDTHRFAPHSKGDDTRSPEIIQNLREQYDPLKILSGRINHAQIIKIESEVINEITEAFQQALASPYPIPTDKCRLSEPEKDVYAT